MAYLWYRVAERRTRDATQQRLATEGQNRTIPYLSGQEIVAARTAADLWKPVGPTIDTAAFGANPAPATAGAAEAPSSKPRSSGSGFLVSRAGDIVTNDHVVEGCRETKVLRAGKRVAAQVIAKNGVKYETKEPGEPLSTPAVAERALKFTVMIECYR